MRIDEFLIARIEDDETAANAAGGKAWRDDGTWWLEGVNHNVIGPDEVAFTHSEYVDHIARNNPARVLAECQAKRAIIEAATESDLTAAALEHHGEQSGYSEAYAYAHVLHILAAVYADHPDFNPAWRVE